MVSRIKFFQLFLVIVLCSSNSIYSCSVPVFRYALERWDRDVYRILVAYKGQLNPNDKKLVEDLISESFLHEGTLNGRIVTINIDDSEQQDTLRHFPELKTIKEPTLCLLYPSSFNKHSIIWKDSLTSNNVKALSKSKKMTTITSDILKGASTVWLLVESKNESQNTLAHQTLQSSLSKLNTTFEIPAGIVQRSGKVTGGLTKKALGPEPDPDNQLRSDIPLNIDFKVHRLKLNEQEPILRAILTNISSDINTQETMLYPFFGRGRFLVPMVGKDIKHEFIEAATTYLSEACSCQVKSQNPGFDILSNTDWLSHFQDD